MEKVTRQEVLENMQDFTVRTVTEFGKPYTLVTVRMKNGFILQESYYVCLDTYAPTITASHVPKLWDLGRKLSVLESKRLQGFPDDFIMPVSDSQAYKQLGNSVSVPLVKKIVKSAIKAYEEL